MKEIFFLRANFINMEFALDTDPSTQGKNMNLSSRTPYIIRSLLLVFGFSLLPQLMMSSDAEARAGGRRSFGQRYQAPSAQRYAPPPQQQPRYPSPPPSSSRGSFMKGMAGGLAGGLLGSMLFNSMGQAAGMGGAGNSGFGLIEFVLIAGLGYFAFRLWKSRQQRPNYMTQTAGTAPIQLDTSWREATPGSAALGSQGNGYFAQGDANLPTPRIDRESAEDIFFRIQAAWTRRDLAPVRELMDNEVARTMEQDIQDLKTQGRINHLENIAVRGVEVVDTWTETDRVFSKTRFTASLLDYTTSETNGQVIEGNNNVPVKFEEYWIFAKTSHQGNWQLAGIEQI